MLLVRLQKNLRIFCFQTTLWLGNLFTSAPVRIVALQWTVIDPGNLPHNLFFQGSTRYQSVHINDLLLPDTMRSIHSLENKKSKDNLLSALVNSKSKLTKKRHISLENRLQNSRVFFSKSVKKSVKRGVRVLRARSAQASHSRRACEASLPSLTLCFQPRSRPFVWLPRVLEYTKIRTVLQSILKNTPWKSNSFKRRCYQRGFIWKVATGNSSTD